jgi:cytosine/adenosine deaminase-related metal-dependent hydrolase
MGTQHPQQHAEWIGQSLERPELAPLDSDHIAALAALVYAEHFPAGTTISGSETHRRASMSCGAARLRPPGWWGLRAGAGYRL